MANQYELYDSHVPSYLQQIGRVGGRSKSGAKVLASKKNLVKARRARAKKRKQK